MRVMLLQSWENQICGQLEFWDLLAGCGFSGAHRVALLTQELKILLAYDFWYLWISGIPGAFLCLDTDFLGISGCELEDHVAGRSMELKVPICARKEDFYH
jgi:hypothetical protein